MRSTGRRPNVVVYVSHDTGRHIGPYGVKTVRTPHAERVAREGVLFERAFCTAPHCSPSRASLFTGRYPHASGVMGLTGAAFGWDFNEGEVHAARHFGALGYETALIGIAHETNTKERRGFDFISAETYAGRVGGVLDRWLAERAAQRDPQRPFFVQIGTHETHRPFLRDGVVPDSSLGVTVPPWLEDGPATRADFAELQGSVARWDEGLGMILDALERHDAGDETLLVVTTDHGLPMARAKATLYDPGVEIMLMLRWPGGGLSAGRRYQELVSNTDVLPTLLEAVGADAGAGRTSNGPGGGPPFQGRSFWPLLTGGDYVPQEMIFVEKTFHTYYDPMRGVRTERFKYICNFEMAAGVMLASDFRLAGSSLENRAAVQTPGHHPHEELYDLAIDPAERTNLAGDPAYEATRARLAAALLTWMRETEDPLLRGPIASPFYARSMRELFAAGLAAPAAPGRSAGAASPAAGD